MSDMSVNDLHYAFAQLGASVADYVNFSADDISGGDFVDFVCGAMESLGILNYSEDDDDE